MKKLLRLTKSLLVMAGLCVGASSAWAKTSVYSEDFETTTIEAQKTAWTNSESSGGWGGTYSSNLAVFTNERGNTSTWFCAYGNNGSRQTTAYYMFATPFTGKAYQFDAKLNLNVGNNNQAPSYFYIMNGAKAKNNEDPSNFLFRIGVNSSGKVTIGNGTDEETSTIGGASSSENLTTIAISSKSYTCSGWFNASCIIDLEQGTAKVTITKGEASETISIDLKSGAKQINGFGVRTGAKTGGVVAMDDLNLYELAYPALTLSSTEEDVDVDGKATVNVTGITGTVTVSSDNESVATASYSEGVVTINGVANGVAYITVKATNDGIEATKTITATVGSVATTTITINYKDDSNNTIKTSKTIDDVSVGSTLTASDVTYDDVIYGTGFRYVNPVLDQTLPYTVVEDGVINITYTAQAAITNVKKIFKAGENVVSNTDVTQDGKYVGDVIYFSFPKYINYSGTLYEKANQASGSYYSQPFELTANDQECVLNYSATETTGIVYYSEGEDIEGATATSAGGNMPGRSSNQQCGYAASDITLKNLEPGIYKATIYLYANSSGGLTLNFLFGETSYEAKQSGATNGGIFTKEFVLNTASDVKWLTSGGTKDGLDYIYIQKTGDLPSTQSVEVTSAGMATYVSDYNLDFSATTLKAYAVAVETKGVAKLTALNEVPAGTPVLLIGATEDVPVLTDAVDAVSGNQLVAGTGAAVATNQTIDEVEYTNMILNKVDEKVGFYFAAGQTVAEGRAYLHIATTLAPDPESGAPMLLVFDGATTAISDATREAQTTAGEMYNLAGQKVGTGYKGIVIVNGRKAILTNNK